MQKKTSAKNLTRGSKIGFNDIDRETALKAVDLFNCLFNFDYLTFDFEDKELYRAAKKLKAELNLSLNEEETQNLLEFIMHGFEFRFSSAKISKKTLNNLCVHHWRNVWVRDFGLFEESDCIF